MESFTQIGVLAADLGRRATSSAYQRTEQGDDPAHDPGAEDQPGSRNLEGHLVGIGEDSGADDAAHDEHGGVENAQAPDEARAGVDFRRRRRLRCRGRHELARDYFLRRGRSNNARISRASVRARSADSRQAREAFPIDGFPSGSAMFSVPAAERERVRWPRWLVVGAWPRRSRSVRESRRAAFELLLRAGDRVAPVVEKLLDPANDFDFAIGRRAVRTCSARLSWGTGLPVAQDDG